MRIFATLVIGFTLGVLTTLAIKRSQPLPLAAMVDSIGSSNMLALSMRMLSLPPSERECNMLQTAFLAYKFLQISVRGLSDRSPSFYSEEDLAYFRDLITEFETAYHYKSDQIPECGEGINQN